MRQAAPFCMPFPERNLAVSLQLPTLMAPGEMSGLPEGRVWAVHHSIPYTTRAIESKKTSDQLNI